MACSILKQICLTEKIIQENPRRSDKTPEILKVSEKQLIKAKTSIKNFLKEQDQSELFQLKLGKLRLNLQLKEKNLTDKLSITQNISKYFSQSENQLDLNFGSVYPKLNSLDFNEFDEKLNDYSIVFNYISSKDNVNTIKSVVSLAKHLETVIDSIDERIKNTLKELKEIEKPSEQNFNVEIKKIKEDIDELQFQVGLAKSSVEKDILQMEITRKTCKVNELRSQNILALSESRCKLYLNSLNSQGGLFHLRTRSFVSQPKPLLPETPLKQNISVLIHDITSLQTLLHSLSHSLSSLTSNSTH